MIIAAVAAVALIFAGVKNLRNASNESGKYSAAPSDVQRWLPDVQKYADKYSVPAEIVMAQIWQESWGDPNAVGEAGELGLGQHKAVAIEDLRSNGYGYFADWQDDPQTQIEATAAFLDLQLKRTGQLANAVAKTRATALEAYNEGYGEAQKDLGPDEYAQEVVSKASKLGYAQID